MSKGLELLKGIKKSKNSTILTELQPFEFHDVDIPVFNLAYSGKIRGGIPEGNTMLTAPAKTYKTIMTLHTLAAWQRKYTDGIAVFWDIEIGHTPEYLKSIGIDTDRVLIPRNAKKNKPINTIEEFEISICEWLTNIEQNPDYKDVRFFFVLDSLGALVSEADVAATDKGEIKADAGRSTKGIKHAFKMIGPRPKVAKIPFIIIGQVYTDFNTYGAPLKVQGGSGPEYFSDNILLITKSNEKEGTEIIGNSFKIKIYESRVVRKGANIPFKAFYGRPLAKYTGLADIGKNLGIIETCRDGQYGAIRHIALPDLKCKNADAETNAEFWERIFNETDYIRTVENYYSITNTSVEEKPVKIDKETGEILE